MDIGLSKQVQHELSVIVTLKAEDEGQVNVLWKKDTLFKVIRFIHHSREGQRQEKRLLNALFIIFIRLPKWYYGVLFVFSFSFHVLKGHDAAKVVKQAVAWCRFK